MWFKSLIHVHCVCCSLLGKMFNNFFSFLITMFNVVLEYVAKYMFSLHICMYMYSVYPWQFMIYIILGQKINDHNENVNLFLSTFLIPWYMYVLVFVSFLSSFDPFCSFYICTLVLYLAFCLISAWIFVCKQNHLSICLHFSKIYMKLKLFFCSWMMDM